MSTIVTRKVYDADGTESVLGIPCTTVTEEFDGSVSVGDVSIDDAFDIQDIDIDDNHSTGVMELVCKIAEVQQQERCIPTDFVPTVKGYPINADGTINWDGEYKEDTLTEIPLAQPIVAGGVTWQKAYECSGNVSALLISVKCFMDNTLKMDGYSVDDATKCVYSLFPQAYLSSASAVVKGDTISNDCTLDVTKGNISTANTDANKKYLFNIMSLKSLLFGCIVKGNIANGGFASWMTTALATNGVNADVLFKCYGEWRDVSKFFEDGDKPYLKGTGSGYIQTDIECSTVEEVHIFMSLSGGTSAYASGLFMIGTKRGLYINPAFKQLWATSATYVGDYTISDKEEFVAYEDKTQVQTITANYTDTPTGNLLLGVFNINTTKYSKEKYWYVSVKYKTGEYALLVPFYRDSMYGFLNLANGNFYGSSNFTYALG